MTHNTATVTNVLAQTGASWVYDVAPDGAVYCGGYDHFQARLNARTDGYHGPAYRVFDNGTVQPF